MTTGSERIDATAVTAIADQPIMLSDKAIPARWHDRTPREVLAMQPRLSEFATPLLTLSAPALARNVAALADWTGRRGLELAPHGKTSMAPQLWQQQLDAGATAITVANLSQFAVAHQFGVSPIMVANEVLDVDGLAWIGRQLQADPEFECWLWVDSEVGVQRLTQALTGVLTDRPLPVLIELGSVGGRAGVRNPLAAIELADLISQSPVLELAGVAGYEAVLSHDADAESLGSVRQYLQRLAALQTELAATGRYRAGSTPIVTVGGSAYFDLVATELASLVEAGTRVIVRSGAYVAHDDGFCAALSPLGNQPRSDGAPLVSALHGWATVLSQPEPELALLDVGKRDLPYDLSLPVPQQLRRDGLPIELSKASVEQLNDQHAFLRFAPGQLVQVGDRVRLGVSHPCTAFDRWTLIPVIDDADAAEPTVVDLVRTYF